MCNWMATLNTKPDSVDADVFNHNLLALSAGNPDATGIGYVQDHQVHVIRYGVPAKSFVNHPPVLRFMAQMASGVDVTMAHARNATHGEPAVRENNHPHLSDKGVLMHKGILNPTVYRSSRGECDSEQMLLALDDVGLKDAIEEMTGSAQLFYMPAPYDYVLLFSGSKGMYLRKNPLETSMQISTMAPKGPLTGYDTLKVDTWCAVGIKTLEIEPVEGVVLKARSIINESSWGSIVDNYIQKNGGGN